MRASQKKFQDLSVTLWWWAAVTEEDPALALIIFGK